MKRKIDVLVLSDVHLGTYGCHAKELLAYLRSVNPKIIVLNGDIIDIWQFSKNYWPDSHMKVIRKLVKWMSAGKRVYYITGNHDDMLRKFKGFKLGHFTICNQLVLDMDGQKTWFCHGDLFDASVRLSPWIARLGGKSYDYLILLNRAVNYVLAKFGRKKISLSKKVKDGVKRAVKFIGDFEMLAAEHAIVQGYHTVVCGHIHQPQYRFIKTAKGEVRYLNSGDWVENLTALEYADGIWTIHAFMENEGANTPKKKPKPARERENALNP